MLIQHFLVSNHYGQEAHENYLVASQFMIQCHPLYSNVLKFLSLPYMLQQRFCSFQIELTFNSHMFLKEFIYHFLYRSYELGQIKIKLATNIETGMVKCLTSMLEKFCRFQSLDAAYPIQQVCRFVFYNFWFFTFPNSSKIIDIF